METYFRRAMNERDQITFQRFLWVGRAEGVSFLLLTLVAMPLKYGWDMPLMVKYLGWAHGVLFMAYMALLFLVAYRLKWDAMRVIYGFLAALLPFGPFVFERSLR